MDVGGRVAMRLRSVLCALFLCGCAPGEEEPPPRTLELTFDVPRFDLGRFSYIYCRTLLGNQIDQDWEFPFDSDDPAGELDWDRYSTIWVVDEDGLSARFDTLPTGGHDTLVVDWDRREQTTISTLWLPDDQDIIPIQFDLPSDVWAPLPDGLGTLP